MKKKIRILLAFCDRLLIAAMKKVNEISDFNDIKKENLGGWGDDREWCILIWKVFWHIT